MKIKVLLLIISLTVSMLASAQQADSSNYCKANFDYSLDTKIMTFAPAAAIQFRDLSIGEVTSWTWIFGNSPDTLSTEQNPLHIFNYNIYSGPGSVNNSGMMPPLFVPTVTLKIITKSGCTSLVSKQIYFRKDSIVPPTPSSCYVLFKAIRNDSIVSIPEMVAYSFYAFAPGNVIKWHWDFGDSTTSDQINPTHSYPFFNANYKVCVSISTSDSCTSSYCSYLYVGTSDTIISPSCKASFSYSNLNSNRNYWSFHDYSAGNPTSWFWDFGDGSYSNEQAPVHFFRKDTIPDSLGYFHVVHSSGIFKVCLTTLNNSNCKSSYCDYVNTNQAIDSSYINPCGYLINMVSSNILGSGSCKAKASASLVDSMGNTINASSYFWSNGSTEATATNLCPNTAYYLIITSENGCQTAGSFAIMDYTMPYSIYGYWTVNGWGSLFNFKYMLPNNSYTCNWIFADSTEIQGSNINYNFAYPDSNNFVTVIVKDSLGNAVYSEKIMLGANSNMGIKKQKSSELVIYPNPVKDELKLSLPNVTTGRIDIIIFDVTGKMIKKEMVYRAGGEDLRMNTSNLSSGLYFLSVSSSSNRIGIAKFIK